MNNCYLLDMPYVEEIETLQDFHYDTIVSCKIPSLCIQAPGDDVHEIDTSNIQNKYIKPLGLSHCHIVNSVEVYIPSIYAYPGPGKIGMRFLITFSGGNINTFNVCGRLYQ